MKNVELKFNDISVDVETEALNIADVSSSVEFKVWDDLFAILAWKFQQTKSGDMYLDGEAAYNELKEKFDLRRK
jgi:hypothetical protein